MDEPAVVFDGVKVRRGAFLLDIPRWEVARGGVVAVLGPNGSGKSTLLRLLPGVEAPHAGTVRVLGRDPWRDPVYVRTRLGYMTDDLPVFPLKVGALLRELSRFYPTWDRALVDELVGRCQLDLSVGADALSTGQGTRLRLVLAAAFSQRSSCSTSRRRGSTSRAGGRCWRRCSTSCRTPGGR